MNEFSPLVSKASAAVAGYSYLKPRLLFPRSPPPLQSLPMVLANAH